MLSVSVKNADRIHAQIRALAPNAAARKKMLWQAGRAVVKVTKARIRAQRSPNGEPFAVGKKRRKVLRKMAKDLKPYANSERVNITWRNNLTARIAKAHQDGFTEQYDVAKAQKVAKRKGEPDYSAPATNAQADALIQEGYRRYVGKFKRGKKSGSIKTQRVSKKWIKENMTVGHAGIVLRILRSKEPAKSWNIEVPARPHLGLSEQDVHDIIATI